LLEEVDREDDLPPGTPDLLEKLLDLAAALLQFAGDPEDGSRARGVAAYVDGAGAFLLAFHALLGRFAATPEHPGKPPASDLSRTRRF
jgi:hypothetical protein